MKALYRNNRKFRYFLCEFGNARFT